MKKSFRISSLLHFLWLLVASKNYAADLMASELTKASKSSDTPEMVIYQQYHERFTANIKCAGHVRLDRIIPKDKSAESDPATFVAMFDRNRNDIYPNEEMSLWIKDNNGNSSGTSSNIEVQPQTINAYLRIAPYYSWNTRLRKGGFTNVAPIGGYNGNGVTTFLYVKSGKAQLDLMQGSYFWTYSATTGKGAISTANWSGYPGYYGAQATCLTKTCNINLVTYIIY